MIAGELRDLNLRLEKVHTAGPGTHQEIFENAFQR